LEKQEPLAKMLQNPVEITGSFKEDIQLRFEVFMVIIIMLMKSWVLAPVGLQVDADVSEKHAVSIFRG
jgi:hypothetical protein